MQHRSQVQKIKQCVDYVCNGHLRERKKKINRKLCPYITHVWIGKVFLMHFYHICLQMIPQGKITQYSSRSIHLDYLSSIFHLFLCLSSILYQDYTELDFIWMIRMRIFKKNMDSFLLVLILRAYCSFNLTFPTTSMKKL